MLFTTGLAELLTFMVVAIAGIAFPSMRRALYERVADRALDRAACRR